MGIFNPDGNEFDGSCNYIIIGSATIPALKASYADKLDKGTVTDMGTQGIGAVTRGTYSADDAKITFRSTIFRSMLMKQFPDVGFGNVRWQIVVVKTHPDVGDDSDLLNNCYCTNISAAIENSNKADEVETTWKIGPGGINWTDDRKKIFDDGNADVGGSIVSQVFSFFF